MTLETSSHIGAKRMEHELGDLALRFSYRNHQIHSAQPKHRLYHWYSASATSLGWTAFVTSD